MWRIWAKGRTARIPTKMMQLVAKLRHLDLANALTVGARLGVNIDNEQRVVELAAGGIKPRHKCMLLWWSLHRHSRRWVKRRGWLQERHKFLSFLSFTSLRVRKFQGVIQADFKPQTRSMRLEFHSTQTAWRATRNLLCPKFCQPART